MLCERHCQKNEETDWENILAKYLLQNWYPKSTKNSENSTVKKKLIKKWAKDLSRHFT